MTTELLLMAGLISAAIVGWWHWENNVKQVPLKEFGLEDVKRVLTFEPESVKNSVLKRGWMTRAQWVQMNKAQLVEIAKEHDKRR